MPIERGTTLNSTQRFNFNERRVHTDVVRVDQCVQLGRVNRCDNRVIDDCIRKYNRLTRVHRDRVTRTDLVLNGIAVMDSGVPINYCTCCQQDATQ